MKGFVSITFTNLRGIDLKGVAPGNNAQKVYYKLDIIKLIIKYMLLIH